VIAIVNVSKRVGPGMQDYEVRINCDVIAKFTHRRSAGLARCLELAAEAVRKAETERMVASVRAKVNSGAF